MKRTVSILLLVVFLFNVGGYYIVFWGLLQHSSSALTHRINHDLYSLEETIEIKIRVNLPYPFHGQQFKRVDGRFEHEGKLYKLIKQKFENDTLMVVCILDKEGGKIADTMRKFVKLTNDVSSTKKIPNLPIKILYDFCQPDCSMGVSNKPCSVALVDSFVQQSLPEGMKQTVSPPPKFKG